MKHWLIEIVAEAEDMEEVQARLDELWDVTAADGGDDVLADKVQGVVNFGTYDERFKIGDRIPGDIQSHGMRVEGTTRALIEALEQIDPQGNRQVRLLIDNSEVRGVMQPAPDTIYLVTHQA